MEDKTKWYNNPQMVGSLLLFWPPIGIYGVYKSEIIEQKWKKLTYGILVLVGMLLVIL